MMSSQFNEQQDISVEGEGLIEKVVHINRVAKVVKGGRRFNFSALVVVGDGKSKVGIGYGKANEISEAIRKGNDRARSSMFEVPVVNGTVPHENLGVFGAGTVLIRPASPGTGVIAGGPVRAVVEACGIRDLLTKSIGSNTPVNMVRATVEALQGLEDSASVAQRRNKNAEDLV
ncbi:MAG: 30S ribosomal protein S5 [Proteobacteria bacterium]|jgi:small subunit ribosomal protein S5|nr:30S ribosomal protein S5 [Pseudomonadota bacterium]NLN61637.1 30S ribosomal protein S5 [Myxococcales bacterium]